MSGHLTVLAESRHRKQQKRQQRRLQKKMLQKHLKIQPISKEPLGHADGQRDIETFLCSGALSSSLDFNKYCRANFARRRFNACRDEMIIC
eukprot:3421762-Karenia_brevis.AAC.1